MLGLRQRIKLFIFEQKDRITRFMGWVVAISSLVTLVSMVFYYGFETSPQQQKNLLTVNRAFFAIFILNYLCRVFFSFERRAMLRSTWLEASLLGLVLINAISFQFFDYPILQNIFSRIGWEGFEPWYVFIIQCYLLMLIGLEVIRSIQHIGKLKVKPTTIFIGSFLMLILLGTGLLMLPAMANGARISFIDALFTSASASCITGLSVLDISTFFTVKGQVLILVLFQAGGLGIISFASFFATFMKKGMGLKQQGMLKELLDNESLTGTVTLLRKVILYTFSIELIAAVLIYNLWGSYSFSSSGIQVFYSVFHAVSAFCNAGFSLFSQGLATPGLNENYTLHLCIALTIFIGALGFPALRDILEIRNVRERLQKPWKKWKLSTQIAVYASLVLVFLGAILFYFLEQKNTLSGQELFPAAVHSLFQSVATRSAGFNTLDLSQLAAPTLVIFIFLMFIGGSSGSTAGGIKTSTFVVIFTAILSTVVGKREVTLRRRTISRELIYKAFAVFVFSATFIFICVVLLSIAEPDIALPRLVFEEVSAFATVGLSTGITAELSTFSKWVLIISMFVGRIGVLSLAFSLSVPVTSHAYQYPKSHIMIG